MESSSRAPRRSGIETPPIVDRVHAPLRKEAHVPTRGASRVVSEAILFIGAVELALVIVLLMDALTPPVTDVLAVVASAVFLGAGPLAAFLTVLAVINLIQSGYKGFAWALVAAIPVGVVISLVSLVFWLVFL